MGQKGGEIEEDFFPSLLEFPRMNGNDRGPRSFWEVGSGQVGDDGLGVV